MSTYIIRVRKNAGDPWTRVRTRRNPNGKWSKRGARFMLWLLQRRGYHGHIVEIKQYPNYTHYTPNFSREELECRCGCNAPPEVQIELIGLSRNLEQMRRHYGKPIRVISGYRCPAYNKKVGGVPDSQHIKGRAADILSSLATQEELAAAALKVSDFRNGGLGKYRAGGLHVDQRGYKARWDSI